MKTPAEALGRHLTDWFAGHPMYSISPGPEALDRVPGLDVVEVAPGPAFGLVSYVSLGCWAAVQKRGAGVEFVLTAREPDPAHVATVTTAAVAHCGTPAGRLDRGSVVPLGRAWSPGSECDHLLVTLPYPYGPNFEFFRWGRNSTRMLWLLPITAAEAAFVAVEGVEALEARLEAMGLPFADPVRPSVV
jgi:hypothetical protein